MKLNNSIILLKENIENYAMFIKWSPSLTVVLRIETGKKTVPLKIGNINGIKPVFLRVGRWNL